MMQKMLLGPHPEVDIVAFPYITFTAAATSLSSLPPMPDATVDRYKHLRCCSSKKN
jgi:hypothetical protein